MYYNINCNKIKYNVIIIQFPDILSYSRTHDSIY